MVVKCQREVNLNIFLNIAVNIFNNISAPLCYIFISVTVFTGKYDYLSPSELGSEITKIAFVSTYLMGCFTQLIDLSDTLTDMAGYIHRIGELIETL
ncbi:predicted protein, partial [Nematostella vectensis]